MSPKLTDFKPDARMFALWKGKPGTGKSILAASMALKGPVYIFDFDGKVNAIHNYYTHILPCPEIINNITHDSFSDYNTAAEKLQSLIDYNPYSGGIIWDSLTTTVNRILSQIYAVKGIADPNWNKGKKVGGIKVTDVEDYMAESNALMRLTEAAKFKIKTNFIMIAHVIQVDMPQMDGSIKSSSSIITAGRKIAEMMPPYYDEIWHFENKTDMSGTKYGVTTQATGVDYARTSLPMPAKFDVTKPIVGWTEIERLIKLGLGEK